MMLSVWRMMDVMKYLDGKRKKKNPNTNTVSGKEEAELRALDQTHSKQSLENVKKTFHMLDVTLSDGGLT